MVGSDCNFTYRVAGDAHSKSLAGIGWQNRTRIVCMHVIRAEMHAVRTCGDSYIGTRIDEQPRAVMTAYDFDSLVGELFEFARRKVALAELDDVHACGAGSFNVGEQLIAADRFCVGTRELCAIGDVVEKQCSAPVSVVPCGDLYKHSAPSRQ